MTRAREHLHLMVPQRFYVGGQAAYGDRHVYGGLTRFIPPQVAQQFEIVAPNAAPAADEASDEATARIDVAAQLRAQWR
jgi:DNA helicase-2/ATP-dependent DNA helicase PcrA